MSRLKDQHEKPELLLPAGSREAFYAALESGADAIYLGLESFNARQRASNFSVYNLPAILQEAHFRNVKIYITVNTVIKNDELPSLLQLLNILEHHRVDAVIIQDWGVYFLIKRYFPSLNIHASTQMSVHNSIGVNFCSKMSFERVILPRELTMNELKKIVSESSIRTEIFVHGALCYAFSGLCLFSSFIGGNGANRGLCTQPCRRIYQQNGIKEPFFSLKDNQQIERIEKFSSMGIASLKVEGRLRPADYVFRVGTTYRGVLNGECNPEDAVSNLRMDFGREKTGYFLGGDISKSISNHTGTGFFLGNVLKSEQSRFAIRSSIPIEKRNRLFVQNDDSGKYEILKIENCENQEDFYWINTPFRVTEGSGVYMASENRMSFPNRFPNMEKIQVPKLSEVKINKILKSLIPWQEQNKKDSYFVRIDSPEWLKNLYPEDFEGIFLNFDKKSLSGFSAGAPILKNNRHRFWIELPSFIGEKELDFYATLCRRFHKMGITRFLLSHPSQVSLLPEKTHFAFNENCYVFNDAAAAFFTRQRAQFWIYPLENDIKNLLGGNDRNGMVAMYFLPALFCSRMPVQLSTETDFRDEAGNTYRKYTRDGITIVTPSNPVCIFSYKKKLSSRGFSRFLIDLTYESPNRSLVKSLLNKLKSSTSVTPSSTFNFIKGLR